MDKKTPHDDQTPLTYSVIFVEPDGTAWPIRPIGGGGSGGGQTATTRASRNSEHDFSVPSYAKRRQRDLANIEYTDISLGTAPP